jgi:SAM-dependent methyltransferase
LSEARVTVTSSLINWWRKQRRNASRRIVLNQLRHVLWEFARESLPEHKRRRYGDAEYDWQLRVDTTSATVGWRERLIGAFHSDYQPIEPEIFREILSRLVIDFSQFTFVDIGSGKGRALLLAREFGFKRIVGVELLAELNEIARANIRKLVGIDSSAEDIESICGDATTFGFPDGPLVVYLFNPLPRAETKTVITNLIASIRRKPRPVYVTYANPVCEAEVFAASQFRKIASTQQYAIFVHEPTRP